MKKIQFVAIGVSALIVSGCIPVIFGAGATGGAVATQERTTGTALDDTDIKIAINNKYIQRDFKDLFNNVNISVTEGRVLLTGNVDKPETSVEAVRLAWTVKGVKEVINEIQVNDKTSLSDYTTDVWISTQVRSRFLFEKNFKSNNYSVETVNQIVYLMGIAQDQAELDKATYIAGTVAHVQKVISHVILKDDPRRAK